MKRLSEQEIERVRLERYAYAAPADHFHEMANAIMDAMEQAQGKCLYATTDDEINAVLDVRLGKNKAEAVAYLDLGTGGYIDIGSDLTDEQLLALPKGKHALGIIGTYGDDGRITPQSDRTAPANKTAESIHIADDVHSKDRTAELESLLLWALYHHQGGMSVVGQPIRRALGIGQHDNLTDEQIAIAKQAALAHKGVEL